MTTNHIAKELEISPGNLYFHFKNKEEIIRDIFRKMTAEIYKIWRPHPRKPIKDPLTITTELFECYWIYRFLHRERFHLTTKDPHLFKLWKNHLSRVEQLMTLSYRKWAKLGLMRPITDLDEMAFINDILIATATAFLQTSESRERQPAQLTVERGQKLVGRLLYPYTLGDTQNAFALFIADRSTTGARPAPFM